MKVEQTDRDAAAQMHPGVARFYINGQSDHLKLVKLFAAHRIAAEQRGYDRAIAEVCAWLRGRGAYWRGGDAADAIEALQHKGASMEGGAG